MIWSISAGLLKGVVIGIANISRHQRQDTLVGRVRINDIHAELALKEPKTLFPYGLGAVAGIISLSLVFEYLLFGTFPSRHLKLAFIGWSAAAFRPCLRRRRRRRSLGRRDQAVTIWHHSRRGDAITVAGGISSSPRAGMRR